MVCLKNNVALLLGLFTVSLMGCGADDADARTARIVWGSLSTSRVARPFTLDEFTGAPPDMTPRCTGGGEGFGEVWHTAYRTGLEGEASGTVMYRLLDCRDREQDARVRGTLLRAFQLRRQDLVAPKETETATTIEQKDAFMGTVDIVSSAGPTACSIEVTRTLSNGAQVYAGTLCGVDVASLGLRDGSAP